jgi:hypothetical protein
MNKFLLVLSFVALATTAKAQFYSVKTNLLGLATTNLNVEAGISVHRNWSLHLPVNYNPWVFSGNKRFQNITVEPGARYWFLESFSQGFIGIQSIYSRFHVGGTNKYRYDGYGVGMGLSYGYSKVIRKRWNLEFEAGLGVLWADYTKYLCKTCGALQGDERKLYLIPSKASISLVYLF